MPAYLATHIQTSTSTDNKECLKHEAHRWLTFQADMASVAVLYDRCTPWSSVLGYRRRCDDFPSSGPECLYTMMHIANIIWYHIISKTLDSRTDTLLSRITVSYRYWPFSMPGMRVVLNWRSYCQEHSGMVLFSIICEKHTTTPCLTNNVLY